MMPLASCNVDMPRCSDDPADKSKYCEEYGPHRGIMHVAPRPQASKFSDPYQRMRGRCLGNLRQDMLS